MTDEVTDGSTVAADGASSSLPAPIEIDVKIELVNGSGNVVSKDRWTILTLLTFGHVPSDVKRIKLPDGPYVLLFTFPPSSNDLHEKYMRGEPLPVDDIRHVERAERIFKGFLHRLSATM